MASEEGKSMEGQIQKSYFVVLGLCCSSEVPLIEKILKPLEGIQKVSVIAPSKTVIVVHDTLQISQLQIVNALNEARLEASIRANGGQKIINKWPNSYIIACGLLLLISLFHKLFHPLQWLALAAVVVGLPQIFMRSIAAIRKCRLDINILMLIAVGGAVALGDYSEAGFIVFLFTMAEWLESMACHKATSGMSELMSMAPQKAILAETGQVVDAKDVKVETMIAVKAGEVIPIDGIVVEGRGEVDERSLTGESFPVAKQPQSLVWAGTLNIDGYISVKTTALAENSAVAKMARLVEEAQNSRSRTQRMIDSFAKYYTPAVVVIAAGVAVVPIIMRAHNQKHWLQLALVLLVSACPCALLLSTPVAIFCTLLMAARTGLLIKGGHILEELAKTKVVAFDKTGTITRGEFAVVELRKLSNEVSIDTLLFWITSIESKSSHPMSLALVNHARLNSIEPKPELVNDFQIYPGEGVSGEINGKKIYIGNKRIAIRAGCMVAAPVVEDIKEAVTVGYVSVGTILVGFFTLSDTCRTGAKESIKELKSMGIKAALLTGDSTAAALHAQKQLGDAFDEIHAELLPEGKVSILSHLKTREGPTTMVGDGMNDAPALAMANVGISMGISGSAVAMETSHITLISNDIRKIPKAIRLARRTQHKIIVNIIFSILPKISIVGLAVGGHPLLWAAVLADVGTCLIVILNSMMLLQTKRHKEEQCCPRTNQGACTRGQCGSESRSGKENSESNLKRHACHKNDEGTEEKTSSHNRSSRKEKHCHADSPAQCFHEQVTCKPKARHKHFVKMACKENSHTDESCLKQSGEAVHEHLISLCSEIANRKRNRCEEHSGGQCDNNAQHCHESIEHKEKETHEHSRPINGEINQCGKCGDKPNGDEVIFKTSELWRAFDKKDAGNYCEKEKEDCLRTTECSSFQAANKRQTGACCRSYSKECIRREACCGSGMIQVPEIIIE